MYFYYWIPVKKHIHLQNEFFPLSTQKKCRISDIDKNFEISMEINPESFDLSIDLLIDGEKDTPRIHNTRLTLKKQEADDNGFVIYRCADTLTEKDVELLSIQVYHCFKSFFHTHEHHDAVSDALIKAYCSESEASPIDYLKHYYDLYVKKFEEYKALVALRTPQKILDKFKEDKDINKAGIALGMADKLIFAALGEKIYADFLLSVCLHYDDTASTEEIQKLYKEYKAHFDVYEKDFNLLKQRYDSIRNIIMSEYAQIINRLQIYLAIFGVIIGVIGVFFSFLLS